MARVLIVAEHDGTALNPSTARCATCARELGAVSIDVAVFSPCSPDVTAQAAQLAGIGKVLHVEHVANTMPALAALLAPQIAELAAGYTHVLGPSTTFGKDVMPRVAALLGVGQLSDVMKAESPYRFRRPIYAGNVVVTIESPPDRVVVATVRTASYPAAERTGSATIEHLRLSTQCPTHTRFIERKTAVSRRPDLQTAVRVVSGGRAFGSAENFALLEALADRLGAALGASRAAVDSGFASNDLQVGQTGKIIAPELYFAIGISGAVQHLTGIKDAGTIVAINKDADAAIFEVADIGLVDDLFRVLPELFAALDPDRVPAVAAIQPRSG